MERDRDRKMTELQCLRGFTCLKIMKVRVGTIRVFHVNLNIYSILWKKTKREMTNSLLAF